MKQHSNFPREKDKHSHKGGIFCHKEIFMSINLLQLLTFGNTIFFSFNDFSVHLFARFHFMNTNIYLAMLIFCNYLWVMGREQLFCAIKFYSNTSEEMQKYYTFKRVFLQYKTSEIKYFFTAPEMFE